MSSVGFMSPLFAGIIIAISSFGGDMTGFLLGKRFRHWKPIQRLVDHEKYQKSWDLFDRHIALITIFGKLIPVVRSTPSLFAAVRGIPARRYMLYSFLGSVLWAFAGVYAGNFLTALLGDNAIAIILGILVLSIIIIAIRFFLIKKRKSQHRKSDNRNNNVPSE
jgi:membrane-associated protein